MAKRNPKATGSPRQWSPAQLAVQAAGKITGDLMNSLQNIRKTFLRIGQLLTEVRDQKHYVTLHHPDLEDYALKRLEMSKTAMYKYMQVYAWVLAKHKEWLDPKTKVRIPQLTEVAGLMWIEQELVKKDLRPGRKATLEGLQKKALAGALPTKELRAAQLRTNKPKMATARMLSSLQALRKRGEREGVSAQLLASLDHTIGVAENDLVIETAGLNFLDAWPGNRSPSRKIRRNTMFA